MNSIDILYEESSDNVIRHKNCIHGGLKRSTSPRCWQNGIEKSIQAAFPGNCEITLKRTDVSWSLVEETWHWITRENHDYYGQLYECPRNRTAHGGKELCREGDRKVKGWSFSFRSIPRKYSDAVKECKLSMENHWKLFGDVSSHSVLKVLYKRLKHCWLVESRFKDNLLIWLDVTDREKEGVWRHTNGTDVTKAIRPWGKSSKLAVEKLQNVLAFECPSSSSDCIFHARAGNIKEYCHACYADVDEIL